MKKKLSFLAIIVLTLCLVGFAVDRIIPASTVHAAGETQVGLSSAGPVEKGDAAVTRPAQPIVWVVIGLVCAIIGIIAVSPLVIGEPGRVLRETGRAEK